MLALRADMDMIVIGGQTLRRDNPSLATRGEANFARRREGERTDHPIKLVVTRDGDIPTDRKFFTDGDGPKLVLHGDWDRPDDLIDAILATAGDHGANDILIEGGATLLRQVLASGRGSEWRLAVSPMRMGGTGHAFLEDPQTLLSTYPVASHVNLGGTDVFTLDLTKHRLTRLMNDAFALSQKCPPSDTAFAVGAIACDETLKGLATGYSRETGEKDHAEEALLSKLEGQTPHTVICTLEPCLTRASKPTGCSERLVKAGAKRVVYAVAEDATFTEQKGLSYLSDHGVELIHLPGFEDQFRAVNRALYG